MSASDHLSPDQWDFDVFHATHEEVQAGNHAARRATLTLSKKAFPSWLDASETAAAWVAERHGTMPTKVMPRF